MLSLVDLVIFIEFEDILNKLTWYKSLGMNSILLNILKVLYLDYKIILFIFIRDLIEDENLSHDK